MSHQFLHVNKLSVIIFSLAVLLLNAQIAVAQTTAFAYQGKLNNNGNPANDNYDLQFKLYDTADVSMGTQHGGTLSYSTVAVSNGVFNVVLDFGACPTCFNGATRFLEISVRRSGDPTFTTLAPRQPILSSPYAIRSLNTAAADGLSVACVNCVTSSQIQSVNGSAVTGAIPVASVPAGSSNYIQNMTTQQPSSNFNVSGNGTVGGTLSANIINSATQYNIGGQRLLSTAGSDNLFAGINAGANNTGTFNAFFGAGAGQANTSATDNNFFGTQAGFSNTTGGRNTFIGSQAGFSNTTGGSNAFFGTFAGYSNTTGIFNEFIGSQAGFSNTTGSGNAFFGNAAGYHNTTACCNSFFGFNVGSSNTTGFRNAFFGDQAGISNITGSGNTLIGDSADVSAGDLTNATAIGAFAQVAQSNSLVLGSISGVNSATADTRVGIGTTAPSERLHVVGNGLFTGNLTVTGTLNANLPSNSGNYIQNTTSLQPSSNFNISGNGLVDGRLGIGTNAPVFKLEVVDASNTGLRVQTNTTGGTVASFGGVGAFNIDANGQVGGRFKVLENGKVGIGNNAPTFRLDVFDQSNAGLRVQNNVSGGTVASFGSFGTFSIDSSGATGGRFTALENGNIGIGTNNPTSKLHVSGTGVIRALVNSDSNAGFGLALSNQAKWSVATVTGGNFQIFNDAIGSNAFWIDSASNNVGIATTTPTARLTVDGGSNRGLVVSTNNSGEFVAQFGAIGSFAIDSLTNGAGRFLVDNNNKVWINMPPPGVPSNNTSDTLIVNGAISAAFPGGPSTTALCKSNAPGSSTIVLCTSSIRYKTNVHTFSSGLNLIRRLRPVSFNWKQGGVKDFGLIAEEVAGVEPLLATYDEKGEIQGVKYDRVSVVLINAVKEQQAQITTQKMQLKQLTEQMQTQQRTLERQTEQIKSLQHMVEQQQQQLVALQRLLLSSHRKSHIRK